MTLEVKAGQAAVARKWEFQPTQLGRDIYNKRSITSLARSPVDDLVSFVIGGVTVVKGEPPLELKELAERRITQGSIVIEQGDGGPQLVDDVYAPSQRRFYQYLRDKQGRMDLVVPDNNMDRVYTKVTRVFEVSGSGWSEKLVEQLGVPGREKTVKAVEGPELVTIDKQQLLVFPGGRGPLYWAQHTFNAIEENAQTQRHVMTGINLLPIISGNVGSADEASAAINSARNAIIFPGDVSVDRVISNAVIGQLIKEAAERRSDYIDAMNTVEKDTPERPVAADREQRSRAMTQFVNDERKALARIMAVLGVELQFDPFIVKTAAERKLEGEILQMVEMELTPEERSRKKRELVGLPERDKVPVAP